MCTTKTRALPSAYFVDLPAMWLATCQAAGSASNPSGLLASQAPNARAAVDFPLAARAMEIANPEHELLPPPPLSNADGPGSTDLCESETETEGDAEAASVVEVDGLPAPPAAAPTVLGDAQATDTVAASARARMIRMPLGRAIGLLGSPGLGWC
jgi:hypothetical protein